MTDGSGLTPGDPLHGGSDTPSTPPTGAVPASRPAPAPREERSAPPLWSGPEERRPGPGYAPGRPIPPGAGGAVPAGSHGGGGQLVLSGWWRRAGAAVIDGILVSAIAAILIVPFGIGFAASDSETGFVALVLGLLASLAVVAVVALFYAPVMMWKTNGRTIGRLATGIRVVRADGRPMTFGTAAVREILLKALVFGTAASFTFGLASLVDFLWPLWDEENRALHDYPVNTRTVIG